VYEALLDARGNDPSPRFAYDQGDLEIMSPSTKHEWLKRLIGRFVEAYTEERGIDIKSVGATTLKSQLKAKGLEPDESYYVQNEPLVRGKDDLDLTVDPPPDLAVEIDISSSSVDKLGIYASLGVPEVWTHDDGLVMYHLPSSGQPIVLPNSKALPDLASSDLDRFLEMRQDRSETQLVRAFRAWVRERHGAG
jgi:Uma2 family endonuclease